MTEQLNDINEFQMKFAEEKFLRLMKRHIRASDMLLSDRDFIQTVYARFNKALAEYIIDVGE